MKRWPITKEQIWLPGGYSGTASGCYSQIAWSVYYGQKRVARYRTWEMCCQHVATAHRRFGL